MFNQNDELFAVHTLAFVCVIQYLNQHRSQFKAQDVSKMM